MGPDNRPGQVMGTQRLWAEEQRAAQRLSSHRLAKRVSEAVVGGSSGGGNATLAVWRVGRLNSSCGPEPLMISPP